MQDSVSFQAALPYSFRNLRREFWRSLGKTFPRAIGVAVGSCYGMGLLLVLPVDFVRTLHKQDLYDGANAARNCGSGPEGEWAACMGKNFPDHRVTSIPDADGVVRRVKISRFVSRMHCRRNAQGEPCV